MKHIYLLFFFAIVSGLLFSECSSSPDFGSGQIDDGTNGQSPQELRAELTQKSWELRTVNVGEHAIYIPENDSMYSLNFFQNGNVEGMDLCNECTGSYVIEVQNTITLRFPDFSCTEMACQGYQGAIDFSETLNGLSNTFHFENGRLYIDVNPENEFPERFKFEDKNASAKEVVLADPANFERSDWPDGDYHSLEAVINRDTLSINLGYSGCAPHDLNLVFSDYFLESDQVQAYAVVAHKKEECRAAFITEENFDLTPLKEQYQEAYNEFLGNIEIIIQKGDETQQKLRYLF